MFYFIFYIISFYLYNYNFVCYRKIKLKLTFTLLLVKRNRLQKPTVMNSVSETCSKLKQEYDSCFNTWFTEKFLRGDNSNDVCGPLFQVYRDCVKVCYISLSYCK